MARCPLPPVPNVPLVPKGLVLVGLNALLMKACGVGPELFGFPADAAGAVDAVDAGGEGGAGSGGSVGFPPAIGIQNSNLLPVGAVDVELPDAGPPPFLSLPNA